MKMLRHVCMLLVMGTISFSCNPDGDNSGKTRLVSFTGNTMGTTYAIKYLDVNKRNFKVGVDSVLVRVNMALSPYVEASVISVVNRQGETDLRKAGFDEDLIAMFVENFETARYVYEKSGGLFDPTVGPLVNYWGFGWQGEKRVVRADSAEVSQILRYVGMQKLTLEERGEALQVVKPDVKMSMDFNALAKGYGVDIVSEYLQNRGISDFMVEIGGEVRASGNNASGQPWVIGINVPDENAAFSAFYEKLKLPDKAMATSGNYRNFYLIDGKRVWHSLNPKTGYPEENDLLSATIIAERCMLADAFATACMVTGLEGSLTMIESTSGLEGYFIYSDDTGNPEVKMTSGMQAFVVR